MLCNVLFQWVDLDCVGVYCSMANVLYLESVKKGLHKVYDKEYIECCYSKYLGTYFICDQTYS